MHVASLITLSIRALCVYAGMCVHTFTGMCAPLVGIIITPQPKKRNTTKVGAESVV